MLYQLHAMGMEALQPLHYAARSTRYFWKHPFNPFAHSWVTHRVTAGLEMFERLSAYYERPAFGYDRIPIDGRDVPIREEVVHSEPWCDLLHFRKDGEWNNQPKMLFIAPMSGHYPTLLRNHIRFFLAEFDCYITNWQNARDVPLEDGAFHLDDYVEYIMKFLRVMGPGVHVDAVCQPGVPGLMATALMSQQNDPARPASLILTSAPVDTRCSPTEVNDYASQHDYEWFQRNVIFDVPWGFKGEGQKVYPGFIQLSGFLSMNLDDHIRRHYKFYQDLIKDDGDSAEAHRKFYDEYLAVMDMSAPFYLETIRRVFLEHHLPRGIAAYRGEGIDLLAIRDVALLTIEGERDDICGANQTHSAHALCTSLPAALKHAHTEPLVGHYGAFNGGYFRSHIGPMIKAFVHQHSHERADNGDVTKDAPTKGAPTKSALTKSAMTRDAAMSGTDTAAMASPAARLRAAGLQETHDNPVGSHAPLNDAIKPDATELGATKPDTGKAAAIPERNVGGISAASALGDGVVSPSKALPAPATVAEATSAALKNATGPKRAAGETNGSKAANEVREAPRRRKPIKPAGS